MVPPAATTASLVASCTSSLLGVTASAVTRYFATGSSFKTLGYTYRMSDVTVGRIVKETSKAILDKLQAAHMTFPSTDQEIESIKQRFWERWRFPNCVGCVDSKHVRIRNPRHSGSMFRNYKQYFSIVLQGVAGPDYKFIAVDVGGYGKESDGGIFSHSILSEKLEKGGLGSQLFVALPGTNIKVPHVILGDEAYPLKTYLMRPFPGYNLDPAKRLFNRRLSKVRQVIECTFGIISSKWRLLQKSIEVEPDFVDTIVQCICLLHNIVIDKEGEQQVSPGQEDSNDDNTTSRPVRFTSLGENRGSNAAYTVRDKFVAFFSEMETV
ncbi:uncharacterized protein LOC134527843 [Bacillus rossius redtenbacheri]|uniref:uncharacterized protein LOC134527843 n=1 Tax=Bacillus rossius redtenbacheri TaxID=93214 RepID=UPI002FDD5E49